MNFKMNFNFKTKQNWILEQKNNNENIKRSYTRITANMSWDMTFIFSLSGRIVVCVHHHEGATSICMQRYMKNIRSHLIPY